MLVADYCRKQKTLTDELTVVGTLIVDKGLAFNILHGLNRRSAYMRTLLSMQHPMQTFLATCSALILEKLTMGSNESPHPLSSLLTPETLAPATPRATSAALLPRLPAVVTLAAPPIATTAAVTPTVATEVAILLTVAVVATSGILEAKPGSPGHRSSTRGLGPFICGSDRAPA